MYDRPISNSSSNSHSKGLGGCLWRLEFQSYVAGLGMLPRHGLGVPSVKHCKQGDAVLTIRLEECN